MIGPLHLGIAVSIAVIFIWAFSDILSKRLVDIFGAQDALLFNQGTATAIFFLLLPAFLANDPLLFSKSPSFYYYTFVSAIANSFAWIAYFHALEGGKLSIAQPITYLWPFVTLGLAIPLLSEAVTLGFWIGCSLALLSIYLVAFSGKGALRFDSSAKWGLLAMALWGFSMFFTKPVVDEGGVFLPTFLTRVFFFPVFLPYYFLSRKILGTRVRKGRDRKFPFWTVLLVGILNSSGFLLYNYSVLLAGASLPALISSLAPAVVLVLSRIMLSERITRRQAIGVAIGIAGLFCVSLF